jgi:hypothetical protein
MKILNKLIPLILLFASFTASALDLSKVNPRDIIGGNPYPADRQLVNPRPAPQPSKQTESQKSRYRGSKQEQALDAQIRAYKLSRKNKTLINRYRGSKQERDLDAQIRNYRASAKENERVFGAPFRPKKEPTLKDLLARGILRVVIDKNGHRYLVDNR